MASPYPRASNPCCHVTPSHFSFLFCNHVLTPVHPSVSILYKCMVLRLSCLITISLLCHRNQSPVHLPSSVRQRASSLPSLPLTHIPLFSLFIGRMLFCFAQIVYVRCVLTIGNLLFGWTCLVRSVIINNQTFKVRVTYLFRTCQKEISVENRHVRLPGPINACTRTYKLLKFEQSSMHDYSRPYYLLYDQRLKHAKWHFVSK